MFLNLRYIPWPRWDEFAQHARDFYAISGFPRIQGAIDGTHIGIINPTTDHNLYFNRKSYTSINVMVGINENKLLKNMSLRFLYVLLCQLNEGSC